MQNNRKNLIILLNNYQFEDTVFDQYIESKLKQGNAAILMHKETDFLGELFKVKDQASKNKPRTLDTDNDETSIQIKQDLQSDNLQGQDLYSVAQSMTQNELVIITVSKNFDTHDLPDVIDQLVTTYPQFNLFFILKTTIDDFDQKWANTEFFEQSLPSEIKDMEIILASLKGLVPVQSHIYKNYKTYYENGSKYAFLLQWSNGDHRVDSQNSLKELVSLGQISNISGRQLNLENFWKEVLFLNSKYPKFGA